MKTSARSQSVVYLLGILFGVSDGCNDTFIEHKCIFEVYCTFSLDISLAEFQNDGKCYPDREYYGNYIPISLTYKTEPTDTLFPNYDSIFRLISSMDLSGNNYYKQPSIESELSNLKLLNVSNNELEVACLYNSHDLKSLEEIDFSHNAITRIEVNKNKFVFSKLVNLSLSFNNLQYIPKATFKMFPDLKHLDLSNNHITNISLSTFEGLTKLSVLRLSHNNINDINETVKLFGINELEELYLNDNHINTLLVRDFENVKKLKMLDLSHNSIIYIEESTFKTLLKLKMLDLSYNRITDIDFDKEDLVSLECLLLKGNNIMQIKVNQLQSLYRLELIDLSRNNISKIESKSFQALGNINNFQISKNPLTGELEANTFGGLHEVPILDLSSTFLSVLQNSSLNGMLKLNELNISHSKISEIQYNAFINTGNIKIIDLSHNKITYFNVNNTHLGKLNQLILNNNVIKSLSSDFLSGMNNLYKICLSYNKITFLGDDTLKDQSDLNYLDLSYNLNLYFKPSLLREAKKLETLILSNTVANVTFHYFGHIPITRLELTYSNISNLNNLNLNQLSQIIFIQLSHNNVSELEIGSFSNLSNVNEIDISFNKISVIQPGVFKDNFLLKKLNISHNRLTEIGYGVLRGLANLNVLDVSFNFIRILEAERFFEAEGLTELIIDHNEIKNISLEVLSGTNLSVLSIGDNPISCKMLSNLIKYKKSQLSITAVRHVDTMEQNSHGITCNIMDYQSKVVHGENLNEKSLYDILNHISKQLSEMTIDEKIRAEVNSSLSTVNKRYYSAISSSKESKSDPFLETCVFLILLLLVCLILITIYKFKLFTFYKRFFSTKHISNEPPEAPDSLSIK